MSDNTTHETYLSPFTWRYGSDGMRKLWSSHEQRRLWRRIWVALADAQQQAGLVTVEQVNELRQHQDDINLKRALEIEAEIHHDLMAEVRTYAEQCPTAGGIIHLGATSMDIEDNADALRLRSALEIIHTRLAALLLHLADMINDKADHVCMAFTHLQPAEPTTIGYRLANYAQDLLFDWQAITRVYKNIRGKGFKGAVGTSASYSELLHGTEMTAEQLETRIMAAIDLEAYPIAHQTYPRRQDWDILNALAGLAMSIYRLAFDVRLLQSPPFGEWAEPFGSKQVGSSAMPFKRNPINAENMNSLARLVASLPRVGWDNAAHCLLERTLDDSGNRRVILPQAFLATDELLRRADKVLKGLRINEDSIQRNLDTYGVFAATERLLMQAVRAGGNRQELHEIIREHSLTAWAAIQHGDANPLIDLLRNDRRVNTLIAENEIPDLLQAHDHTGNAPERARNFATTIRHTLINDD
jgi:adenylosuccinate lyase